MNTSTQEFHSSVAPCDQWGTAHVCYACASASSSRGALNDIATALESAGIPCHIDQTGGMTMVGVARLKSGITVTWNDEILIKSPVDYDHEDFEYDGDVLLSFEPYSETHEGDQVTFTANAVTIIKELAGN